MNQTNVLLSLVVLIHGGVTAFQTGLMPSHSNIELLRQDIRLKSSVLDELADLSEKSSVDNLSTIELPPLLSKIVDERREYELNLGKAMDVLRHDYPGMIHKTPDFSIYHDEIKVVDPSGVQVSGIANYKSSFTFVQTMAKFFYNMDASTVQHRMVYDFARQSIRIPWNAVLVPKVVGNRRNSMYVDGISVYKMDSNSGKIIDHTVERVLVNNIPLAQPNLILNVLRREAFEPSGARIPVGVGALFDLE